MDYSRGYKSQRRLLSLTDLIVAMEKFKDILNKVVLWSFCAAIVMAPFSKIFLKIALGFSLILIIIEWVLLRCSGDKKSLFPVTFIHPYFLLFLAFSLFSVFLSIDRHQSQRVFFERWIYYFLFFSFGAWFASQKEKVYKSIIYSVFALGAVIFAGAVWQYIYFGTGIENRLWGVFNHPIDITGWLIFIMPLAFSIALFDEQRKIRNLASLTVLLSFFPLIFHRGRAAWIVIGLIFYIIFLIRSYKYGWFKNFRRLVIFILIFTSFLYIVYKNLPEYYRKRISSISNPQNWSGRPILWSEAFPIIKDNLFFGVGPGISQGLVGNYKGVVNPAVIRNKIHYFHNVYLTVTAETGIFGGMTFIVIFMIFLMSAVFDRDKRLPFYNLPSWVIGLFFMVVAQLIASLFGDGINIGMGLAPVFWLFFGMAVYGLHESRRLAGSKVIESPIRRTLRPTISLVVLAKNEEANIRRCLESGVGFADEMIVVDDESDDKTAAIALECGAKVFKRRLDNDFSGQRNFAMDKASCDWVFFLDADETLSRDLKQEIDLKLGEEKFVAYNMPIKNYFFGRALDHSIAQDYKIRLFKKGFVVFYEKIHERPAITGGLGTLNSFFNHNMPTSIDKIIMKTLMYSDLEVDRILAEKDSISLSKIKFRLTLKAIKLFWKLYVSKQGYRDKMPGFIWCVISVMGAEIKWLKVYEKAYALNKLK